MNQVSLNSGSGCNDAGTDQSKSELWSPYHLVGIPSQPGYKQTVSDQPGTVVTNLPPVFGEASVVCLLCSPFSTRLGRSFRQLAVRTGMMPPHFVTPTEHDRKETTTLRQQILRVAGVQQPIPPTFSPPKGATKLQRYYPLEIGIRLWGFSFPRARKCHRTS